MHISIIIVNYNAGDALLACIGSAVRTVQGCEIIVVDNASTDRSIDQVTATYRNNSAVRIVRNMRNEGFSVACNLGARSSCGEWLLFLNPDCVLSDGAVSNLASCLETNPDAGMAGGLLLNADGSEQAGCRRGVPTPMTTIVRIFHLAWLARRIPKYLVDFNLHQQPLPDHTIEVPAISGACMLVRRSAYEDVGGLDEQYFLHCEDLDWCMRFGIRGWKILFVPSAEITHHQGTCSRDRRVFVEWHKHNGMIRFYRKFFGANYPAPLMWLVTIAVWGRFSLLALQTALARSGGIAIPRRASALHLEKAVVAEHNPQTAAVRAS